MSNNKINKVGGFSGGETNIDWSKVTSFKLDGSELNYKKTKNKKWKKYYNGF